MVLDMFLFIQMEEVWGWFLFVELQIWTKMASARIQTADFVLRQVWTREQLRNFEVADRYCERHLVVRFSFPLLEALCIDGIT